MSVLLSLTPNVATEPSFAGCSPTVHRAWSVALTGLLVPADRHRDIRARFYGAVADAVGRKPNTVPGVTEIHAAALLPDADDETRVAFLNAVAAIIVDFDLGLYRVGYRRTRRMLELFQTDQAILGIAFGGLLHLMKGELAATSIWPVMETDRSEAQDRAFAGSIQYADHIEAHLGPAMLTRDATNLGEALYSTKRSVHGALVDCAAYLLNVRTLAALGLPLSLYKQRLSPIADRLAPAIRFDEIITMGHDKPATGAPLTGPYRHAVPITPSDTDII